MTLGEFRKLTKDMDDSVIMTIFNESSEWYGEEEMDIEAWAYTPKVQDKSFLSGNKGTQSYLIFDFSNGG